MKTQHIAKTVPDLVRFISLGSDDPKEKGPVVVMIMIASGQIVTGSYSREEPKITSMTDVLKNNSELQELVNELIVTGTPFVSETGTGDLVCRLKWEITDPISTPTK